MHRREFITGTVAFCCTASFLSLEGCTGYKSVTADRTEGKLSVKKSDITDSPFVIVKSSGLNAPVLLKKENADTYTSVLMLCTHKQCELKPQGSILYCPCHGSEFSHEGKVLKEPADKDLVQYKTSADNNYIHIHLQ